LYGFVRPLTGETYWWILPLVNTQLCGFCPGIGCRSGQTDCVSSRSSRMASESGFRNSRGTTFNFFTSLFTGITTGGKVMTLSQWTHC